MLQDQHHVAEDQCHQITRQTPHNQAFEPEKGLTHLCSLSSQVVLRLCEPQKIATLPVHRNDLHIQMIIK